MRLRLIIVFLVSCTTVIAADEEDGAGNPSLFKQPRVNEDNDVRNDVEERKSMEDPCAEKVCANGHECDVDEHGGAICVCTRVCRQDDRKVCSDTNVTFENHCELFRQRCLCDVNKPDCKDVNFRQVNIDYFGACREMPQCTDDEMAQFPIRLRDWLFVIIEELARRKVLSDGELELARQAKNDAKNWVLPTIWKFCDLDKSRDRQVTTHELVAMSAALKRYEHCTGPFLQQCDKDGSGAISLAEWGACLQLQTDEIEDKCDTLQKD